MASKRWMCLALVGLLVNDPAAGQPVDDLAKRFGAREGIEHASLSPDGTQLAFVAPRAGQGSAVFIVPLDGSAEPKVIASASGDPERVGACRWAALKRLICSMYGVTRLDSGEIANMSRQVALDIDGQNAKVIDRRGGSGVKLGYSLYGGSVIDWLPDGDGDVLMTHNFIPEAETGTRLAERRDGLGVIRLDTRTLSSSIVEQPDASGGEFITDGRGNVRIKGLRETSSGYVTGNTTYYYRAKGSKDWKPLSKVVKEDGFDPYGIDPDLDVAYGLKKVNGRTAAFSMSLDGQATEKMLFAHPDVDVDGFVRIGRRGRIVGASYATDRRSVHYFDPGLAKLAASLAKAIPDLPLIRFVDASVDESKLLIWAGSDINPGRYYLLDRTTKEMSEILPARPELAGLTLAPMKAVTYKATDGAAVPGYLTLPPGKTDAKGLPGIVMPHGGPGARDEWGFDWLAQYFAARGYAVLQPNFRGSAGYGDDWFVENGFQSWNVAIGDVNEGGRWLVSQGVDPSKLAIFGWSYGGYAALQSGVADPDLFKAIVAVAPVTDLPLLKEEWRGWSTYRLQRDFIGSGPHLQQGSPARNASRIKAPVLMFHGGMDRNVALAQARKMQASLKDAGKASELVEYEKLDHYLEDAAVRTELLSRSDAFIRKAIGL